jgi:hypothetical protein
MTNKFWGPPDDEEPLPDWMNPETYRNGNQNRSRGKSLNEAIMDAAKKPQKMLTMLKDELRNKKVKAPKMPRLFQSYKEIYDRIS